MNLEVPFVGGDLSAHTHTSPLKTLEASQPRNEGGNFICPNDTRQVLAGEARPKGQVDAFGELPHLGDLSASEHMFVDVIARTRRVDLHFCCMAIDADEQCQQECKTSQNVP